MMLTNSYSPAESTHVPSTSAQPFFKQFIAWLTNAAGDLGNLVVAKIEKPEPRVFQIQGQSGELFWEIYDPTTGRSIYCLTDEEALQYFDRSC